MARSSAKTPLVTSASSLVGHRFPLIDRQGYDRRVLHGRRGECAVLDELVARARGGRSAVLVIRGEAGIGKSALLGYAAEQADGMRVLRAVGVESESELPYAALHQLVHRVIDRAEDLAGPQRQALRAALGLEAGESDRFAVSAAVLNLLAELSEEQPVLCLVDDAQWLDRASADALLFAARRLEAEPIAALLAVREPAERQLEISDLPSMPLGGLDPDAASALLDARSDGAMAPMLRQRLVESSAGNPLALIELPTALSDQQPVSVWAFGERFPLTATLERSFLDRVRLLPDDAQRLLLLAASNDSDDADVVLQAAHAMDMGPDAVVAVEDSDLLRFAGHRLQFRHPLVRSAVYESAHDDDRRRAHGALAGALQAEAHADRRAWHRALAAVATDEAVAAELESTAERAQRRSGYAAAARALNRAAQLTPGTVDRARRLVQAGDAAWTGGDKQAAMALLDTADGLDPPPRLRAEILRLRAIMQLRAGDPVMAHDLFVAAADTTDDASKALWLLMLAAEASTYAGRMDWLEALGNRARERNVSSPRDGFVRSMLSGIAHTLRGEYDAAIPLLRESVELAKRTTNPHELVSAGSGCLYLGDELGALRFYQRAEDECRRRGALATLPFALEFVAHAQTVADRYPAAVAAATEGEQLARETGQIASRAHHLSILALAAGKQGREEDCLARAEQALEIALPHGLCSRRSTRAGRSA